MKTVSYIITIALIIFLTATGAVAASSSASSGTIATTESMVHGDSVIVVTDTVYVEIIKYVEVERGVKTPKNDKSRVSEWKNDAKINHFTWGADLGSSMDLTNQSLTSFDLSACFGYRHKAMRFIGLGAGINVMVTNASRVYPVYAQVRTTFTPNNRFVFMDAKAGIAFANLYNQVNRRPAYCSLGIGFTLASGINFSSHITLSYTYMPLKGVEVTEMPRAMKDFHGASIRLGAAF